MKRLFISINCSDETKNQLLLVQNKIKSQSVKGNFSRPENLHLTLAFLGETPEEQIPSICKCIEESLDPPIAPFALVFSQTGCFTHSAKELWWIGAKRDDPFLRVLSDLRQRIVNGLLASSIKFDNRQFNPHITLGREIKHDAPIVIPKQEIIYPVKRVSLMRSEHLDRVLVYTEEFGADVFIA